MKALPDEAPMKPEKKSEKNPDAKPERLPWETQAPKPSNKTYTVWSSDD